MAPSKILLSGSSNFVIVKKKKTEKSESVLLYLLHQSGNFIVFKWIPLVDNFQLSTDAAVEEGER